VKRKTQQKKQILYRIQAFQGTDVESKDLLRRNEYNWSLKPESFWTSSEDGIVHTLDADVQAQIVRSYVCAKGGDG